LDKHDVGQKCFIVLDTIIHYLKAYIKWKPSDQPRKEIKGMAIGDSFDVMDLLSEDSQ